MSKIQCKGCSYKPSEHDTLQGYCMLCAVEKIKKTKLLETENKLLKERLEALEALLICYRVQKNPSEKLHKKLDKTKRALEE